MKIFGDSEPVKLHGKRLPERGFKTIIISNSVYVHVVWSRHKFIQVFSVYVKSSISFYDF